ncbi:response regulator [Aggregatimonas sangjinii]|nr:response regulator [Aggregatimonas sangjinii]
MRTILIKVYCLLAPLASMIAQENGKMTFSKIENGLFNSWISCIEQDENGFIWVGTQDGLHRYDGHTFEVFRNSAKNIPSLGGTWIRTITIDSKKNYWIGTYGGGLIKFSPENTSFKNFAQDNPEDFPARVIHQTMLIGKHAILSATDKGFQLHNSETDTVSNFGFGKNSSEMALAEGELFISEEERLFKYDIPTREKKLAYSFESPIKILKYIPGHGLLVGLAGKMLLFEQGKPTRENLLENAIVSLAPDKKGNYIAATANSLFRFDPESFDLTPIDTDFNFEKHNIITIYLDRQNNLWLGTDKGLYKERKYNKAFIGTGVDVHARRIVKHENSLYFGGNQGLFRAVNGATSKQLSGSKTTALYGEGNQLFASGDQSLVYTYTNDILHSTIENFSQKEGMTTYGLAKDGRQRLWVGSWEGLYIFDAQHRLLKSIPLKTDSSGRDSKIIKIHLDAKDRLWIITAAYGVYMIEGASDMDLDSVASRIVNFRAKKGVANTLTSDVVLTLEEDQEGQLWFGTGLGVVRYLEETGDFSRLRYQNDLFDKKVMALRKDGNRNLWISTINDGLYVYDEKEGNIHHYTENDGLISNAFLFGSGFYDAATDFMYFGTDEGVQKIDLSRYYTPRKDIVPLITDIQVSNREGKTIFAPMQAPYLQEIVLEPSQNDFSTRFSAMDFEAPEKICYAYSLDDAPWKMTDLQTAYFSNVPYGRHELKFKALQDGISTNEHPETLRIDVRPPWYLSRTAKVMYLFLLLFAAWGVYQYLKWRWRMRYNLKLKEEEAVRLKQLNDHKSKLYTNIAHEFKTPLTLIAGPIDSKLRDGNISDRDRTSLSIVHRNANRLTTLVDQLLELASLESGVLSLNIASGNLGLFLKILSKSFAYQAQLKRVSYDIEVEVVNEVWYDEDIIEKIVTNLLSNALKYVPEQGKCWFKVAKNQDFIEISVKNTVRDSAALRLDKLFTRFYQDNSFSEGIGVGLALVKELVTLYGGSVDVALEDGEVIRFLVRLPYLRDAFKTANLANNGAHTNCGNLEEQIEPKIQSATSINGELPSLLLVEDHAEIRTFVKQALQQQYRILEADNGLSGLEIALSKVPDIILSDIQMPHCSGIELCNALKADEKTSHIPIILLTGSGGEESELKGLNSGADDFVTKPFKVRVLERRVSNLIHQRKKLRDRYSKELILKPKDIVVSSTDETFLNKVQEILDQHLYNPSFNAETFSKKALMSRMQLHRKLLAFTGLSTSAFIRSQRLKQAIKLLETSDMNINEVAYATGFNTPTYFMKCFKETFKKTPSEYLLSLQD